MGNGNNILDGKPEINHFKMVEAMGIKIFLRGPLGWYYLATKFHETLPSGSKDIHYSIRPKIP
jgi:hypothetical protein